MRILILNDVAIPLGGAELTTFALRDGLRARGHDVRVFASSAFDDQGPSEADYTCFGTPSGVRKVVRMLNPSAAMRLRQALADFEPDVVHVRMFLTQLSPSILPILRSRPSLYHATWYEAVCPTGHKLLPDGSICTEPAGLACRRNGCLTPPVWAGLMLQRAALRRWWGAFDAVVANGSAVARVLERHGIGPVEVVHNGVRPSPARPPLAEPPLVLYAGRLAPEKGVAVLVRAFAIVAETIPAARLLIAGEGPQRAALEALVAELGLRNAVEFAGRLPRPELEERAGSAWAQAVPSLWAEPFGNVVAEAMARGTAVVASNAGGPAEIVRPGETGLLAAPGDVDGLAAALLEVLGDRALAERLGEAGRTVAAEDLSFDGWLARFETIYERLRQRRAA
jgi:glycosyltransferase involved in cell wall biosynthesis